MKNFQQESLFSNLAHRLGDLRAEVITGISELVRADNGTVLLKDPISVDDRRDNYVLSVSLLDGNKLLFETQQGFALNDYSFSLDDLVLIWSQL